MSDDLRERVSLRPCPFCGPKRQKPILHKGKGVKCHTCGAWGPAWEKPTGEEWNTRAALDTMLAKAREDALREAAERLLGSINREYGDHRDYRKAILDLIPTAEDT